MRRRDSGIDEDEEAAKVMMRRYRAMLGYDDAVADESVADPYERWVEDAALLRLSSGRPYQPGSTALVLPLWPRVAGPTGNRPEPSGMCCSRQRNVPTCC
jgi:hypothetical protein